VGIVSTGEVLRLDAILEATERGAGAPATMEAHRLGPDQGDGRGDDHRDDHRDDKGAT